MSELIKKHIDAFEQFGNGCDYDAAVKELKIALECLNEKMDKILKVAEKLENRSSSVKNFSNETH